MDYQIEICDTIGYWECSYYYIKDKLKNFKGKPVNVKISSLGGDTFEGFKINQLFREHGQVTAHLSGFVASAATIIAMGCAKVVMAKNALFLIHNCASWVDTWGYMNKEDLAETIKSFERAIVNQEKIDHVAATMYADKCKKDVQDMKTLMCQEVWLTTQEVKDLGLIDEISDVETPVSSKMMMQMSASSLPKLPENFSLTTDDDNVKPSFVSRLATELAKVWNPNPQLKLQDETHSQTQNTTMSKKFVSIMAILVLEALESKDGKFELNETQMQAIEDNVSSLKKKLEDLTSAKDKLATDMQKQIDALKSQIADKDKEITALKSAAPEPKNVQQQQGSDDNAPLSDADAIKLASEFMGVNI